MQVVEIITPERIACKVSASSKKRLLELISDSLAKDHPTLNQQDIFESFIAREKLGSTALGHGVALPHGRVKLSKNTIGAFFQLETGIDYDAEDQQPVDLIFAMLVPEESTDEHLKLLSQLAEKFSSEEFRNKLHQTSNNKEIYNLFENWSSV